MILLYRILSGDMIWFALGGLSSIIGWLSVCWLRNKWARIIIGAILSCLGILLAHALFEVFMSWYTTPLGPGLELSR